MLRGRASLVTGSTRGIGLGILKALAKEGANVVMHGIDADEPAQKQEAQTVEADCNVRVLRSSADLNHPSQIREMIDRIHSDFGSLDVLVNNAGIQFVAEIEKMPDETWNEIIAVNLSSNFHSIKRALPKMKEHGWGRIINIGSMHALVASPFKTPYNAAKHGMAGLTKTVALETAETGVTCNAICPAYVFTDMVKNQLDANARVRGISREQVISDVLLRDQPTKKFVEVDDIAAMVAPHQSVPGR